MSNLIYTVVILSIVLGVLVFVHELGHYLAAKMFGVWVHRFAIGIGKPIPGMSFRRGETEYAIAWLPLGGYVKMASSEEEPASSVLEGGATTHDVPPGRVFEAKPIWQRMVIILAGVTLNAVFALLVFSGLAWKNGRRTDPTTTIGHVNAAQLPPAAQVLADIPSGTRITAIDGKPVNSWDDITERLTAANTNQMVIEFANHAPVTIELHRDALAERGRLATALEPQLAPVVGSTVPGYPARAAGLQVDDSVVTINDEPITQWSDAVQHIKSSADRAITIKVIRKGEPVTISVTPRPEREVPTDTTSAMVGRIGASARTPFKTEKLNLVQAIGAGADATVSSAGTIFRTLRGLATGQVSRKEVGGPILIGQMAAEQARNGIDNLLAFMALISINLAVVNLLPIPVLDGGAFLILAVEGIIRRRLPSKVREAVALIGLAMVVLLMVVAFWNDFARLLGR